MNIEIQTLASGVILRAAGRIDATWSDHLLSVVRQAIREGRHRILIEASAVDYLSSAGIRALLKIRREAEAVSGSFGLVRASPFVKDTLRMSGLELLLLPDSELENLGAAPSVETRAAVSGAPSTRIETQELDPRAGVRVEAYRGWTPWAPVSPASVRSFSFEQPRFGMGIGAAGADARDAAGRFGEFVALSGAVLWMPGDDADRPDFLEQTDRFIPRMHALQALVGEGSFSHVLRVTPDASGAACGFSELYAQALAATGSNAAALVGLVEAEGLVGAALARSPGRIGAEDHPERFPDIREWMSFCGERVHGQSLAMLVAFVAHGDAGPLAPHLKPLPSRPDLRVHAHAAALAYRPLPRGVTDVSASVRMALEDNMPAGVLHLLEDARPAVGLGESACIRGVCWCAPVQSVSEAQP